MTLKGYHFSGTGAWVDKLDPRWKLAALVPAALAIAFLRHWPAAGAAFIGSMLLAALARLPLRWYLARVGAALIVVAPLAILLPFLHTDGGQRWEIGPLRLSMHGLLAGLRLVLKCLAIVNLMAVLFATAPLHANLKAAQALRVPGLLVQLLMLTYRYIFVLAAELSRLRIALRVRGYRTRPNLHSYRTMGHAVGTLLVRGSERAERVGQAMRCRGFDGRFRSLAEFRTTAADVAFATVIWGLATALLIADWLGFSTFA